MNEIENEHFDVCLCEAIIPCVHCRLIIFWGKPCIADCSLDFSYAFCSVCVSVGQTNVLMCCLTPFLSISLCSARQALSVYPCQSPSCLVHIPTVLWGWAVHFLLLVRYVPNVVKRSVWEQCIYWGPTTDQPATDLTFWKILNGHISATGHPIHFMFGSRVGFSGTADRMVLLPVRPNPRSRPSAVLRNFEWPYLWYGSSGPIHICKSTKRVKVQEKIMREE